MYTLPFFERIKIHEGKSLNDKEVVKDLKNDLDQLVIDMQKLPALIKLSLNFIGVNSSIFNAKKSMDNIIIQNNVDYNVNQLRKSINNLMNILNNNKQFDNSIKGFLGENYSSRFKIVFDVVNKS